MIHSLAGGELREQKVYNFVKLEFQENVGEYLWYISPFDDLNVGDYVLAPFGIVDQPQKAKVIRIDKNVNSQAAPISPKHTKIIYKKL